MEISNNYEIWYNWDEREEEWRSGSSGYQKVELVCNAMYGRPTPEIKSVFLILHSFSCLPCLNMSNSFISRWTINRDDRNELHTQNIFKVSDGPGVN